VPWQTVGTCGYLTRAYDIGHNPDMPQLRINLIYASMAAFVTYPSVCMPNGTIAVAELYTDHQSWLKLWIQRRVGCTLEAADLAQDTFIRVLQRQRKEVGFTIRYPRTYLCTIANSLLIDHLRRRKVEQAYLDALQQLPQAVSIDPEEREIMLEALVRLDKMLDALPASVRTTFLLSRLDGLPYPQIAAHLGISLRTVKRHMQQAYERCLDLML
jgi:RNA polymerase sigma factor, sigma-70 family